MVTKEKKEFIQFTNLDGIQNKISNRYENIKQVWIIFLFFIIFYLSAIYNSSWKIIRARWILAEGIILIGGIIFISYLLGKYELGKRKKTIKELMNEIKENFLFVGILFISLGIRVFQMFAMPIWDSGEYYGRLITATEKFDFSLTSFLDNFNLANHPNYGYTFFTSIGEFLFPRKIWGVNLVVLILTAFSLVYLYKIFNKYMKINPSIAGLLCGIFSFSPLILGTSGYYNPDYGIALFFIFIIYFLLEKKYILFTFWSICFVFTKEVSAIIYFFFIVGIIISQTFKVKEKKSKYYLNNIFKNPCLYISGFSALLYIGYMKYIGGITKWKQVEDAGTNFKWDNNGFNCFGIDGEYILLKLQQIFIINYRWIITLSIIIMLILLMINVKKQNKLTTIPILGIALSLISYICFSCIYITYALVRYNYISDLLLILIAGILIKKIEVKFNKNFIVNFFLVGICILFSVESFITTDPISKILYPKVSTNSISMFYPGYMKKDIYYGDNLVYNNQYSFLTKSYDQFLTAIDYDEEKIVVFPGIFEGSQINGNGEIYQVNWDKVNKKRTFSYVSQTVIPIKVEMIENILNIKSKKNLPDEIVIPFIPYFYENMGENEIKEKLDKTYQLVEEGKTKGIQGFIKYQRYKKK